MMQKIKQLPRRCFQAFGVILITFLVILAFDENLPSEASGIDKSQIEDKTMDNHARTVRQNIERHGFHVTYVGAGDRPSFCYTTGIFETHAIPELIVSSLPPGLSNELISQYVDRFKASAPIVGRRIKAIDERFDYYLIPADHDKIKDHVLVTRKYYGERPFECLQLVYPDPAMRFPDDEGYLHDQEIFGNYPPNEDDGEPVSQD